LKIRSFKRKKNGFYQIFLEEMEPIIIHEDLILKYNLLIEKKLDKHLLNKIEIENKKYIVYQTAINLLKARLRSTKELKEILIKKEFIKKDIEDVIITLTKQGYLNDFVYAESFVHDKIKFSKDGPEKIKSNLINNGINNNDIIKAMKIYTNELEQEKLKKIIDSKIKQNKNKSTSVLKRKILITLINNGYHKENIIPFLDEVKNNNDQDLYQKTYEKERKKLERKYSGKELEYRLNQKMYSKGFYKNDY